MGYISDKFRTIYKKINDNKKTSVAILCTLTTIVIILSMLLLHINSDTATCYAGNYICDAPYVTIPDVTVPNITVLNVDNKSGKELDKFINTSLSTTVSTAASANSIVTIPVTVKENTSHTIMSNAIKSNTNIQPSTTLYEPKRKYTCSHPKYAISQSLFSKSEKNIYIIMTIMLGLFVLCVTVYYVFYNKWRQGRGFVTIFHSGVNIYIRIMLALLFVTLLIVPIVIIIYLSLHRTFKDIYSAFQASIIGSLICVYSIILNQIDRDGDYLVPLNLTFIIVITLVIIGSIIMQTAEADKLNNNMLYSSINDTISIIFEIIIIILIVLKIITIVWAFKLLRKTPDGDKYSVSNIIFIFSQITYVTLLFGCFWLYIDYKIKCNNTTIHCKPVVNTSYDKNGDLITDTYCKPTDNMSISRTMIKNSLIALMIFSIITLLTSTISAMLFIK